MATKYSFLNTPPPCLVLFSVGARNARARAAGGGPAAKEVLAIGAGGNTVCKRASGAVARPRREVGDVDRLQIQVAAGQAGGVGRGRGAARDVLPGGARYTRRAR